MSETRADSVPVLLDPKSLTKEIDIYQQVITICDEYMGEKRQEDRGLEWAEGSPSVEDQQ